MTQKSSGKRSSRTSKEFNFMSFLWRFIATLTLVLLTYNPTRFSFVGWLQNTMASETASLGPEHFVVGVLILIGWAILLSATQRSLGTLGLILIGRLLGGIVWLMIDQNLLSMGSVSSLTWVIEICLAVLLAIGLL